jgi:teichuronic acid exporter
MSEQVAAGRTRLGAALLWSYTLSFGRFAIGGGLTFVLAAILDPASFGVMFMAMIWVAFILMLMQHATLPVIQQPNLEERHFSAAFWALLVGAVVVTGLTFAAAPALAALNQTPQLTAVLRALSPMVVMEAASAIPTAVLRRRMEFRGLAVRGLVGTAVGGAVGVVMAALGYGVWALVGQQLASSATYAAMLWAARPWVPRFGPVRAELREMQATALKSVGGFFGYFASRRTDAIIMGALFGPVAVGLYRLATKVTEMVTDLASSALNQVSLPDLAALHGEPRAFIQRLGLYVHANAIIAFPLLGIVAGTAQPVVAILGPDWAAAAAPLRVLCLASSLWVVFSLLCTVLMAAQRPGAEALFNWGRAVVSGITVTVAAVLTAGSSIATRIMAIAFAILVLEIVMATLMWQLTFRRVLRSSSRPVLAAMAPAAGAGAIAALTGTLVQAVLPASTPVVVALFAVGAAAALAGGALLLATDSRAMAYARRLAAKLPLTKGLVAAPNPLVNTPGDQPGLTTAPVSSHTLPDQTLPGTLAT